MGMEMTLGYERARDLISLSVKNDARPIVLAEISDETKKILFDEAFCDASGIFCVELEDFLMNYVYSIEKQRTLLSYHYIIVDNIINLRGKSGTLKIISTFIENMKNYNVSVMFFGKEAFREMEEVLRICGSKINYIIKIEDIERNTENEN